MSINLVLQRVGLNDLKTKQNKKNSHFHWAHRTTNRLSAFPEDGGSRELKM